MKDVMPILDPAQSRQRIAALPKGPLAIILNEDDVDLTATVSHHQRLGFAATIVASTAAPDDLHADMVIDVSAGTELFEVINTLMPAIQDRWVFACHNAEYLFFPFCETRTISDALQFVSEERRDAVFCAVLDLYSDDPKFGEQGLGDALAYFDRTGYFALDRFDGADRQERQVDLFGGLKWRYAEHIPWERQRIDRISLFRGAEDLEMSRDFRFNKPELNTVNCAWHNNLTCVVASTRVAKSLRRNPGSMHEVGSFRWGQSERFSWRSQQLMDLGLMEPGQWF